MVAASPFVEQAREPDRRFVVEVHRMREVAPVSLEFHRDHLARLGVIAESGGIGHADEFVFDNRIVDLQRLWHDLAQVAVGTLPDWAREMYGFALPPPELMERESVRQLLGALDLAFESLPGVLEARERIELRTRA